MALALRWRPRVARRGADLPGSRGAHHQSLPTRRLGRHHGAAAGAEAQRGDAREFHCRDAAGAGGNTGAELVAKSAPDGYTLLFTAPGPLAINPTLYRNGLGYDPRRISRRSRCSAPRRWCDGLERRACQELAGTDRARQGEAGQPLFGSAGIGTTPHLTAELFKSMASIDSSRALSRHRPGDDRPDGGISSSSSTSCRRACRRSRPAR